MGGAGVHGAELAGLLVPHTVALGRIVIADLSHQRAEVGQGDAEEGLCLALTRGHQEPVYVALVAYPKHENVAVDDLVHQGGQRQLTGRCRSQIEMLIHPMPVPGRHGGGRPLVDETLHGLIRQRRAYLASLE